MAEQKINLKITTETPNSERIGALAAELDRLASQGGKAGPKFAKLAADMRAMEPAASRAQGMFGRLRESITGLSGAAGQLPGVLGKIAGFLGLGGAGLAGGVLAVAKSAADAADSMGKLAQRTGVSTESLSRLAYAASLSDASTTDLEMGFKSLSEKMQDAVDGGKESGAMFQRLGISVQNADGSLRGVDDVFADLAERFQGMPDGAEKTAIAVDLLSRSGLQLIPTLNNGRDGLKALADEADRFGKTISTEAAARAAEFNDNLARLQALSNGLAIEIGSSLIPALNALAEDFLRASKAGLSFADALVGIGLSDPTKTASEQIDTISRKLEELARKREEALSFAGGRAESSSLIPLIDREIDRKTKELEYWRGLAKEAQDKAGQEQAKSAGARQRIEQGLLTEHARLEKLRAVESGRANADILKDDRTLLAERVKEAREATNEQMKGAERLRDALRGAWQSSIDAAREARKEAAAFFKQGDAAASSRNQQAQDRRNNGLSDEQRDDNAIRSSRDLVDRAAAAAVFAQNAALDGRAEIAKGHAEDALDLAKQAADYVGKIGDDETAARLLEQIGAAEKSALQTQGKLREQEGNAQQALASAINQEIQSAEQRIQTLKSELDRPLSIELDISAAEAKIVSLKRQLDDLNSKAGGASSLTQGDLRRFDDGASGPSDSLNVEVRAETVQAQSALDDVQKAVEAIPSKKTVILETVTRGTATFSDPASLFNSQQNGYASGGYIRGPGSATSDSIFARLSNGEYVVRAAAVRRYGVDVLHRLNSLQLPRFAAGGLVSSGAAASIMNGGGDQPKTAAVNLVLPGVGSWPMQTTVDVQSELLRVVQRAALQRGGRR